MAVSNRLKNGHTPFHPLGLLCCGFAGPFLAALAARGPRKKTKKTGGKTHEKKQGKTDGKRLLVGTGDGREGIKEPKSPKRLSGRSRNYQMY